MAEIQEYYIYNIPVYSNILNQILSVWKYKFWFCHEKFVNINPMFRWVIANSSSKLNWGRWRITCIDKLKLKKLSNPL